MSLTSNVDPVARRDVSEKGKNVVWRQAGPDGSVMIGAMTFTSCARAGVVTSDSVLDWLRGKARGASEAWTCWLLRR